MTIDRASIGGRANWSGAAFELRLGVQFCVYILVGDAAGLGPGAARRVQLQAPEPVDDLILEFETGTRWAIQAKAGTSVRVGWNSDRPFGKALCQLYDGVTSGQIDLAPASLDRVELAVDHRAHPSLTGFGEWLDKARHHHEWAHFVAASTGDEREWAQKLPALLEAPADDDLLAFLKRLHVRRTPAPDEWWSHLRGQLSVAGVPDPDTADRILDALLARVAEIAPHAGQLNDDDVRRACEGVPGLPRPGAPPFRLFQTPTEDDIYRELKMPPIRVGRFVTRPELDQALDSEQGVLVAGRPGSGKSHALIKLALTRPEWPIVVVARHFQADDLSRLAAALRRIHTPYQLLWDDVHEKPGLFADAVLRLAEPGGRMRVLAAYRDQHRDKVRERVTPDLCRRAGINPDPVQLHPFDATQAVEMAGAVVEALDLAPDGAALVALARHVWEGDGGPLFALSTGLLLQQEERRSGSVRAADVARLPEELLDTWRHLYERLADRPNGFPMQSLLDVLHFLHRIACPPNARLAELLYTRVLGHNPGEYVRASRALAQEGWLRREGEDLAAHDVTLEAVPEEPDSFGCFARFARQDVAGEELALGLLRGSLALFHAARISYVRTARERRAAVIEAAELGSSAVTDFRAIEHVAYLGMSLNNVSSFYSDLAGLEETREGRGQWLRQAVDAIEESVRLYRNLGLQADLAMSLNNAANLYSDLAGLEETREGRGQRLRQAVDAIEESVRLYRDLGLQADLATSLNNAANRYSDLAGLEETREGRGERLRQAVDAIEESVRIRRDLGLQAELAMSLNNAANRYSELTGLEETREGRGQWLRQAVDAIEESVRLHRDMGLQADLAASLNNASGFYSDLAGLEETREGRGQRLRQAVDAVEESVRTRRDLGLQAELASSLNNAAKFYSELAGLEETREGRGQRLRQAVDAIEESVCLYRDLGLQAELTTSLNNAAKFYSELAGLEETREGRGARLRQAVDAVEESVRIRRDLDLQAELAASLNNASLCYSELAGLEETREGRGERLRQAVDAIEESARIRRALGLQADLAMSLGTIAITYRAVAEAADDPQEQIVWLRKALESIEEAVERFRAAGVVRYLIFALRDDVICHVMLSGRTGELDHARVLALCREGEALCGPMGDEQNLAFFQQVRQQLEQA